MTRRKKTDTADELMEMVSMLPWWAGTALAVMAYALLHYIAERPMTTATQPGQMGSLVLQTWGRTLATMIQRTAKRGARAGSAFWGCSAYPACRGTRPVA